MERTKHRLVILWGVICILFAFSITSTAQYAGNITVFVKDQNGDNANCFNGACTACSGWVYLYPFTGGSLQVRDSNGNGLYDQSCCGGTTVTSITTAA